MSKISLASNVSGTGIFTLSSPATNTNRTLTLPDSTGTLLDTNGGTITGTLTVTGVTTLGNGAVLGVPTSGTITNLTGLPLTTGVTGTLPVANGGTGITSFGSGVATFLGTPSSANLASAVTDETGSGALVFATSPTLVTPTLGVATATSLQGIIGNVTPAAGSFTTLGASSTATLNTLVSSGATLTGGTINSMTVGATTASTGAFTTLGATGAFTGTTGTFSAAATDNGVTPIITVINTTVNGYGVLKLQGNARGGILGFYNGATAQAAIDGQANQVGIYAGSDASGTKVASFTSTGLAVTGTLSATDVIKQTGNPSLAAAGATEAFVAHNTGYGAVFYGQGTTYDVALLDRNTNPRLTVTTAGAAVTGTLSATGTLSGGTSGTAYSFSGSAPATSLTLTSGGDVGIGASGSPTGKLNVVTDNTHNGGATFDSTGTTQIWMRDTNATSNTRNWGFQISGGDFNILRANDDRASGFVTPVSFAQAPANSLIIDSSGNLGIGTSSPAQTLHVKTSTSATPITLGVLSNATGLPALSFNGAYASTTMAGIYSNGAASASLYYEVPSGHSHFFGIADVTKMTLDSSGNLGIGTSSPGYKLDVLGNVNRFAGASVDGIFLSTVAATDISYYGANYYNNNGTEGVNASSRASWRIATLLAGSPTFSIGYRAPNAGAGTFSTPLTIDSSGNLGIGTTSPATILNVSRDSGLATGTGTTVAIQIGDTSGDGGAGTWNTTQQFSAVQFFSADTSGVGAAVRASVGATMETVYGSPSALTFFTNGSTNTEKMRLDSSGRLGIGTQTPDTTTLLTVAGAVTITGQNTGHGASRLKLGQDTSAISQIRFYGADASTAGILQFTGSSSDGAVGAERMRISAAGDVTVSTGNLIVGTAGKGIDFSADPSAAGMTSELLDDYEEGTWTPVIQGGTTAGTYTYEAARTGGKYTKVGNMVTVWGVVRIDSITTAGTGGLRIGGLPFDGGSRFAPSWSNSDSLMVNLYASGVNVSAATYPPPLMGTLGDGVSSFDVVSYGKNYAVGTVIGDLSGANWIYEISGSYTTT